MAATPPPFFALLIASLVLTPAAASAGEKEAPTCSWRAPAADGTADDPGGDPGSPWDPARRLTDAGWRAVDDHFAMYHLGLWTSEDLAALEATPGVALAVLHPVPHQRDADTVARPEEAAAVQWPERVAPGEIVLVAVASARPAEDWVLYPAAPPSEGSVPPVAAASAVTDLGATGFYRVHRLVTGSPEDWAGTSWVARRVDLNPLELETRLELSTGSAALRIGGDSPQVIASGTFSVRSASSELLPAPVVANLSLRGPGAGLFAIEVLPAGDEPAASSARNVRVLDRLDFQVLAPASTLAESAFAQQILPPGEALVLEVAVEIVSFAGTDGEDLDLGLSVDGFSVAPGEAVVFDPAQIAPRDVVQRSAWLEVWRPLPPPGP